MFSAIILVLLWLLQIVFLSSFYNSMKRSEIIKIGETVQKAYEEEDFEDTISDIAFSNSILIFITDENGNALYSFDEHRIK